MKFTLEMNGKKVSMFYSEVSKELIIDTSDSRIKVFIDSETKEQNNALFFDHLADTYNHYMRHILDNGTEIMPEDGVIQ